MGGRREQRQRGLGLRCSLHTRLFHYADNRSSSSTPCIPSPARSPPPLPPPPRTPRTPHPPHSPASRRVRSTRSPSTSALLAAAASRPDVTSSRSRRLRSGGGLGWGARGRRNRSGAGGQSSGVFDGRKKSPTPQPQTGGRAADTAPHCKPSPFHQFSPAPIPPPPPSSAGRLSACLTHL